MRVSFLTSVVDGPAFLGEMLESIAAQTYSDVELVLVIDKPTSQTTEAELVAVATKYDTKLAVTLLINDVRLGLTASLNKAAAAATGAIFIRIDADDKCTPERASVIAPYFERGFHFVGNTTRLQNQQGQIVGAYPARELSHAESSQRLLNLKRVAAHSGLAFSRTLFEGINGYDTYYQFSQDYDFMLRALEATSGTDFIILNAPLSIVTLHPAAISQSSNREAQLLFQLEALIRFHRRSARDAADRPDQDINALIQSKKSWKLIQLSQRFKAQMRSASRLSLLLSFATRPKAWVAILLERYLLRRLINQIVST